MQKKDKALGYNQELNIGVNRVIKGLKNICKQEGRLQYLVGLTRWQYKFVYYLLQYVGSFEYLSDISLSSLLYKVDCCLLNKDTL